MNSLAKLRQILSQGPQEAGSLRAQLGVSAPTLARLVADDPGILRFGRARATKYARLREVPGTGLRRFRVQEVQTDGRIVPMGHLYPVFGGTGSGGYVHLAEDGTGHYSAGLPWWLVDMTPQGFLGRVFARRAGDGQHGMSPPPVDPNYWSDDQRLIALASPFWHPVGNLWVGETGRVTPTPEMAREDFAKLAEAALAGEPVGSSAGGEQPKFCVRTRLPGRTHATEVLVKFSWGESQPARTRRADLLVAEAVAARLLAASGIPAVTSHLERTGDFVFLITERADRVGEHGMLGVVSLGALDDEFVGGRHGWARATHDLAAAGILAAECATVVRRVEVFAKLIGNTDRHAGNLSFYRAGLKIGGLFPIYDMTPMHYAPTRQGHLPDGPLDVARLCAAAEPTDLAVMTPLAGRFWHQVAAHPLVSREFQALAATNAAALDGLPDERDH